MTHALGIRSLLCALLVAACAAPAGAGDALLKDLFPGVAFSRHLGTADTDLFAGSQVRFQSRGTTYIALTYYEPYPGGVGNRYVSFALLEQAGGKYKLRLDEVAADDGAGIEYPQPFLYRLGQQDLVVFPDCHRGCGYSFFRLGARPTRVTVQRFEGLAADEIFPGRAEYRFDAGGLTAAFHVARRDDPTCCPSRGTLLLTYDLRGNEFRIVRAERKAQEPG
jgi:hypothetical protein